MDRILIFETVKTVDNETFTVTVWSDGTISILNKNDDCAISKASVKELYYMIKERS